MRHPSEQTLALYAGGDLGFWMRRRMRSHLGGCAACRHEVEGFTEAGDRLRSLAGETLEGLEWNLLAAEMTANVHLGLEAGECVTPLYRAVLARWTGWKPAMVLAAALMVVVMAYWVNAGRPLTSDIAHVPAAQPQGIMLEATAGGLELNDHGRVLTLKHPKDREVTFSVTADTVRARYVDSESGQVTINNVYVQ